MKSKILSLLMPCCLLALAWAVHSPNAPLAPASGLDELFAPRTSAVPENYLETVHKALDYLVKNQMADGHWEGDGGQHPVAMTGLVGVAVLMEGDRVYERRGFMRDERAKYSANTDKAVDWLMAKSQAGRDGLIFSDHPSETARYMEGHGLATLFLAGAYQAEPNGTRREQLTDVLHSAVKYIVKAQSSQGGWHHTSKAEGHDFAAISATVIQIQALQAAENAGIPVPRETVNDAQEFLRSALATIEKGAGRQIPPVDVAAALACRSNPNPVSKEECCKNWLKYCLAEIPVGRDITFGRDAFAHYYYAQGLNNLAFAGGDESFAIRWSAYCTTTFDHLQISQNKDGSWPAAHDGISSGPVYATALWCTILQFDNERHPSVQRLRAIK